METRDAISDFVSAMEAAGVKPLEPISHRLGDGQLVRFRADGDKPGRKNGWAVLHTDGCPAGAFGCYRLGISEKWRAGSSKSMTPQQKRDRAEKWRQASVARQASIEEAWADAAAKARELWNRGVPADEKHPYLAKKSIAGEGFRVNGDVLLVPMQDGEGKLWNVQRIYADGTKRFLPAARTTGLMWICGKPDAVICIGEGVSTVAAVRHATGHAVVASFSAKNLKAVAQAIHDRWPSLDKVICADDDAHLVDNPSVRRNLGLECAREAALAIGGRLALPPRGE